MSGLMLSVQKCQPYLQKYGYEGRWERVYLNSDRVLQINLHPGNSHEIFFVGAAFCIWFPCDRDSSSEKARLSLDWK